MVSKKMDDKATVADNKISVFHLDGGTTVLTLLVMESLKKRGKQYGVLQERRKCLLQ
jgi:hypothetical protein